MAPREASRVKRTRRPGGGRGGRSRGSEAGGGGTGVGSGAWRIAFLVVAIVTVVSVNLHATERALHHETQLGPTTHGATRLVQLARGGFRGFIGGDEEDSGARWNAPLQKLKAANGKLTKMVAESVQGAKVATETAESETLATQEFLNGRTPPPSASARVSQWSKTTVVMMTTTTTTTTIAMPATTATAPTVVATICTADSIPLHHQHILFGFDKTTKEEALPEFYGGINGSDAKVAPRIVGLDTCARFMATGGGRAAGVRLVAGPAGLFNTGTNLMEQLLRTNCKVSGWEITATTWNNFQRVHIS